MEKDKITENTGICKICGCTWNDPCEHPDEGPCWWVDDTETICSHCYIEEIRDDPRTIQPKGKQQLKDNFTN